MTRSAGFTLLVLDESVDVGPATVGELMKAFKQKSKAVDFIARAWRDDEPNPYLINNPGRPLWRALVWTMVFIAAICVTLSVVSIILAKFVFGPLVFFKYLYMYGLILASLLVPLAALMFLLRLLWWNDLEVPPSAGPKGE